MSEIKVNSIKGVGASAAAITVNNTDGTCTANITNNLSNRRLTINGDMRIAQRGVSSTVSNYGTVDRFRVDYGGHDEAVTQEQVAVTSGGAYDSGFRHCLKLTNGNQTSGAGASDYAQITAKLEAQDIRNSGWNYTSTSSFITLSFWIKSSVAQVFSGSLRTTDGTAQSFKFDTPSVSANTWTKVTKTILGNSNLQFDNNSDLGLTVYFFPFIGTTYTSSNGNTETWITGATDTYANDLTSTWWTTNDATFEITGVQLEVGSVATDFEHRSYSQELALCQRYYEVLVSGTGKTWGGLAAMYGASEVHHQCQWVEKRATPTLDYVSGTNYYKYYGNGADGQTNNLNQFLYVSTKSGGIIVDNLGTNLLAGGAAFSLTNNASAFVAISAEL